MTGMARISVGPLRGGESMGGEGVNEMYSFMQNEPNFSVLGLGTRIVRVERTQTKPILGSGGEAGELWDGV